MPSDGKPLLSADEIKIIELWIASGASATKPLADYPDRARAQAGESCACAAGAGLAAACEGNCRAGKGSRRETRAAFANCHGWFDSANGERAPPL